jgi:hypothetical protein
MLIKPLDEEEMEDVIKSATTSEASYLCNHYPLKLICKKEHLQNTPIRNRKR